MLHYVPAYSTFPADMHPSGMEPHYNSVQSTSLPRQGSGLTPSGLKPSRTWGQAPSGARMPRNNPTSALDNPMSPPKMPDHLEEKLRHLDEEYELQEDDDVPVDYSLKFTDDMSRTPAIQSPRNAEIYENRPLLPTSAPVQYSKPPLIPKQNSTSISVMAKTNILHVPNTNKAHHTQSTPKVGFSVPDTVLLANDDRFAPEETPTNFSARFAEDEVYQHINDSYEQRMYAPPPLVNGEKLENEGEEWMKEYKVEDTPLCFSHHSSLSKLDEDVSVGEKSQNPGAEVDSSARKQNESDYDPDEDGDKFESGLITPGQYNFNSRTPLYQETPLVFSRQSPMSSLSDVGTPSPHSEVASDPGSRLVSGWTSPSELPDSPGQSMPVSRQRSLTNIHEATNKPFTDVNQSKQAIQPTARKPPISDANNLNQVKSISAPIKSIGYTATLPSCDEMKKFSDEPAMSEMTSFSGLTIDDDKIAPLGHMTTLPATKEVLEKDNEKKDSVSPDTIGRRAIKQAGYTTSLPTNDEIKHFTHEGTLSPMATLSEISALREHNDGFIRGIRSPNRNSFTSRSSATGASIPNAPVTGNQDHSPSVKEGSNSGSKSTVSDPASPVLQESKDLLEEDDTSSLDDSASDDEDAELMLMQCIELGKPSKK